MDQAQNWYLNIEDLYNKTEVHSINTSKGDTADVGVFSNYSQITALCLNFWMLRSWHILDGETVCRRRTDYIINIYPKRLNII